MTDSKTEKKIEQGEPTETRPPQEILCSFCGKPMSLYWHEDLADAIACRQKVVAGLPARAAAPVEPPKCGKYLGDWRNLNVRCQLPKHHEGNCSSEPPATELVEPDPRPQCDHSKNCPLHSEMGKRCEDYAAAASPVARPQPDCKCGHTAAQHKQCPEGEYCDVKGCPCVDGNAEGFTLPAARVEQPTPSNFLSDFQMPSCSQCGAPYKVYCAECGNFKPAAPVVEQRGFQANLPEEVEFAKEIAADLGLGCKASNPYHKGCLYCGAVNKIAAMLKNRAASQRTEGEGQHGKN